MNRSRLALSILIVMLAVVSLRIFVQLTRYDRAVAAAPRDVPLLTSFAATFPTAQHIISYSDGRYGPPTWQSEVSFFDRYVLTMKMPIRINYFGNRVTRDGSPTWQFIEVTSIQRTPTGGVEIKYGDTREFTQSHWDALIRASGRIELVFPDLETTSPVPGFQYEFDR